MSLLIGVASYLSPAKLQGALGSIQQHTTGDWRCCVIHNEVPGNPQDVEALSVARAFAAGDPRFTVVVQSNTGYCGAVNRLLGMAIGDGVEFVAYCDNDIEIRTPDWNEQLAGVLRRNPECGWVFPGDGHFPLNNGKYRECLWHAGYCWMLSMAARQKMEEREVAMFASAYLRAGYMNEKLGHHEEVELMGRLRLAGFTTACLPAVDVIHHETATRADSRDHQPGGRIHDGVVKWMNFSNGYFCGDSLKYSMTAYDPRALRYTDWHPNALYLERLTLSYFPDWNADPEVVSVPGVGPMHAVKVLKPLGPYKGRAI